MLQRLTEDAIIMNELPESREMSLFALFIVVRALCKGVPAPVPDSLSRSLVPPDVTLAGVTL